MKIKLDTLTVQIEPKLKDKMITYYAKTRKSFRLQVEEALKEYFKAQKPI